VNTPKSKDSITRYRITYCFAFFETLSFQDSKIQTGIKKAVNKTIDSDKPSIAKERNKLDEKIQESS